MVMAERGKQKRWLCVLLLSSLNYIHITWGGSLLYFTVIWWPAFPGEAGLMSWLEPFIADNENFCNTNIIFGMGKPTVSKLSGPLLWSFIRCPTKDLHPHRLESRVKVWIKDYLVAKHCWPSKTFHFLEVDIDVQQIEIVQEICDGLKEGRY